MHLCARYYQFQTALSPLIPRHLLNMVQSTQQARLLVHDELCWYGFHQSTVPALVFKTISKAAVNQLLRVSLGYTARNINSIICAKRERQITRYLSQYFVEKINRPGCQPIDFVYAGSENIRGWHFRAVFTINPRHCPVQILKSRPGYQAFARDPLETVTQDRQYFHLLPGFRSEPAM